MKDRVYWIETMHAFCHAPYSDPPCARDFDFKIISAYMIGDPEERAVMECSFSEMVSVINDWQSGGDRFFIESGFDEKCPKCSGNRRRHNGD